VVGEDGACIPIRHLVVQRGFTARQGVRARATSNAFDNRCYGESMRYNSLSIPLANGSWSCELVPARDYRSPSGGSLPFIQSDEKRQLESDRWKATAATLAGTFAPLMISGGPSPATSTRSAPSCAIA
jgi:hypothetical protein